MRIGYADPPYPRQSKRHYLDHADYAGEVDHAELVERLERDYDCWILHTGSVNLQEILPLCPPLNGDCRVMAWVKPFAAYKRNVKVAYSWEPIIVRGGRGAEPNRIDGLTMRDYIAESITLRRGLTGAKPERVCWWLFEIVGALPDDELVDLYPGTGAVSRAWDSWIAQPQLTADYG